MSSAPVSPTPAPIPTFVANQPISIEITVSKDGGWNFPEPTVSMVIARPPGNLFGDSTEFLTGLQDQKITPIPGGDTPTSISYRITGRVPKATLGTYHIVQLLLSSQNWSNPNDLQYREKSIDFVASLKPGDTPLSFRISNQADEMWHNYNPGLMSTPLVTINSIKNG